MTLTAKEQEMMLLLWEGLRNKEIAHRLGIHEKTVWSRRKQLHAKLGASTMVHLGRRAVELGFVPVVKVDA